MNRPKHNPTMADVARLAGTSTMTVSRALKGSDAVTMETRSRVMRAVDELGYILDLSAPALSSRRTGVVPVLIPSLNNSNFSEIVQGIFEVFHGEAEPQQILLGCTGYSRHQEETLVQTLLQRRPEGMIVTGGLHTPRARQLLLRAEIPVLELWELPENPIDHAIGFSGSTVIQDMVARLRSRGYRNIAYIGGHSTDDTRKNERLAGYQQAVESLGLERAHVISMGHPPITVNHGCQAVVRLLEEWPAVEAVVCVSDLPAFGAIMECHRRGWKVPERLAVAGFGDFEIARSCWPAITTASINGAEIGHRAARLMVEAIAARASGAPLERRTITIPHAIIERESTRR